MLDIINYFPISFACMLPRLFATPWTVSGSSVHWDFPGRAGMLPFCTRGSLDLLSASSCKFLTFEDGTRSEESFNYWRDANLP